MITGGAVSLTVLLLLYGPYTRFVLSVAHRVSSSRRHLATFVGVLFLVPLALLVV
jgi:hypothetical protein